MNLTKLFLVSALSLGVSGFVAGNAGCACLLAGADGKTATMRANNSSTGGYSDPFGLGLLGIIADGVTNWPFYQMDTNGCVKAVNHLALLDNLPPEFSGADGTQVAYVTRMADSTYFGSTRDSTGDGYVSGNPPAGYGGVAFSGAAPCNGALFVDDIRVRQLPPGAPALWTYVTDNHAFGHPRANRETSAAGLSLVPLRTLAQLVDTATPIAIDDATGEISDLNIEAEVRTQIPTGTYPLKFSVTEISVGDLTIEPNDVHFVMTFGGGLTPPRMAINSNHPELKAVAAQLAPIVEDAVLSGEMVDASVTLNDSVTFTTSDVLEMLSQKSEMEYVYGRDQVRELYRFAGVY